MHLKSFGFARAILGSASLIVALAAAPASAQAPKTESANGHGTLANSGPRGDRQFSFHAHLRADGTVKGSATLINPAFQGNPTSPAPFQLHLDISCMKVVGNIAVFGGTTKRTNDPNLVEAAFFTVQDNGEPGKNDRISRVFFFDGSPPTTGDPQLCQLTDPDAFPLEQIKNGNIQVRG